MHPFYRNCNGNDQHMHLFRRQMPHRIFFQHITTIVKMKKCRNTARIYYLFHKQFISPKLYKNFGLKPPRNDEFICGFDSNDCIFCQLVFITQNKSNAIATDYHLHNVNMIAKRFNNLQTIISIDQSQRSICSFIFHMFLFCEQVAIILSLFGLFFKTSSRAIITKNENPIECEQKVVEANEILCNRICDALYAFNI